MTSGLEQLLRPLRLRANQTDDSDLRQAVALLLDAQGRPPSERRGMTMTSFVEAMQWPSRR